MLPVHYPEQYHRQMVKLVPVFSEEGFGARMPIIDY